MHNNINEKFLTFEFKPDMEMVKLYERNFNTKISLTPTFMKKNLRIFFWKMGQMSKQSTELMERPKLKLFKKKHITMTFFQISRNINFYKNQIVLQFNFHPKQLFHFLL